VVVLQPDCQPLNFDSNEEDPRNPQPDQPPRATTLPSPARFLRPLPRRMHHPGASHPRPQMAAGRRRGPPTWMNAIRSCPLHSAAARHRPRRRRQTLRSHFRLDALISHASRAQLGGCSSAISTGGSTRDGQDLRFVYAAASWNNSGSLSAFCRASQRWGGPCFCPINADGGESRSRVREELVNHLKRNAGKMLDQWG